MPTSSTENLRELSVFADGQQIADGYRIRVRGKSTMTCQPDPWQCDIINLSDTDLAKLRQAKTVSVMGKRRSVIVSGRPFDVEINSRLGKRITTILFSDGEDFWRSFVNLSIGKGATMTDTIRTLLSSCSSPVSLASVPSTVLRTVRGQSYFGRTAEALTGLVSGLGWRAYTYQGAAYIVEPGGGLHEKVINEDDLLDYPKICDGAVRVKTDVVALMPGQLVDMRTDTIHGTYRLAAVTIDADSESGPWNCELTLMDESTMTARGTEEWRGI